MNCEKHPIGFDNNCGKCFPILNRQSPEDKRKESGNKVFTLVGNFHVHTCGARWATKPPYCGTCLQTANWLELT